MKKHKIISYLNHYYQIQNASFKEDEHQTAALLNNYEKIVFNIDHLDEVALTKAVKLDQIIHQYLTDHDYKTLFLKKISIYELSEESELNRFLEDVLNFNKQYQMEFYNTRIGSWI